VYFTFKATSTNEGPRRVRERERETIHVGFLISNVLTLPLYFFLLFSLCISYIPLFLFTTHTQLTHQNKDLLKSVECSNQGCIRIKTKKNSCACSDLNLLEANLQQILSFETWMSVATCVWHMSEPVVNFINILQAAFLPISLLENNFNAKL